MIKHKKEYLEFIEKQKIGADSRSSYISYLNSVSSLIKKDISPEILKSESDLSKIKSKLDLLKLPSSTISNYCSAMRQYIAFVKSQDPKMTEELKVEIKVKSSNDKVLNSIISCISELECSKFFLDHIGKSQSAQKQIVKEFQTLAESCLKNSLKEIVWKIEYRPNKKFRDSIDIFGEADGFVVVIEMDKNRADQVAKKFVSRLALLPHTKIYFVSLCYPGTKNMSMKECVKYFEYCSAIAVRMENIHYAGFIIS